MLNTVSHACLSSIPEKRWLTSSQNLVTVIALAAFTLLAALTTGYAFYQYWNKRKVTPHASSTPASPQSHLDITQALPKDVLVEIIKRSDFPFPNTINKAFKQAHDHFLKISFHDCQKSPLLGERANRIEQKYPHASPKQKIEALKQELLADIRAEAFKKNLLDAPGPISVERLEQAERWLDDANLITLCEKHQIIRDFLQTIQTQDNASQAQDIRTWMKNNPNELAAIKVLYANWPYYGYDKQPTGGLTKLPKEIGLFTQLQEIHLANNRLTTLPPEMANLTQLQKIHLGNNRLTIFPSVICQLTSLEHLDLKNDCIRKVGPRPESLNDKKIEQLPPHLREVELDCLSQDFGNSLKNEDNCLEKLPEEIGQLTQLKTLLVSSNNLKSLPAGISKLTQLKTLGLAYNPLTNLPDEMKQMASLEIILLDRDQFQRFCSNC